MLKNESGFSLAIILVATVIILIVIVLGYRVSKTQQSNNNQKYFSQLTLITQTYYEHQAKALGIKTADKPTIKRCYQSGGGPFDDGHLRCGIEISRKIQIEPNNNLINGLLRKLIMVLKQDDFSVVGGKETVGVNGASFSAGRYNKDPHCTTHITYSPNSAYADAKTSLEYSLECSKDASAVPNGFSYTPPR